LVDDEVGVGVVLETLAHLLAIAVRLVSGIVIRVAV
jgi:hypothetical protein